MTRGTLERCLETLRKLHTRWGPWLRVVEVILPLAVIAVLFSAEVFNVLVPSLARAVLDGVASAIHLSAVDPPTRWNLVAQIAKFALAWFPAVLAVLRMRRHRLVWLIPLAGISLALLPFTMAGGEAWHWVVLAVMAPAAYLVRRPWFRLAALVPPLVIFLPGANHGFGMLIWPPSRLVARCAANDGERPENLTPDLLRTGYHGVTVLDDAHVLLTSEGNGNGHSFWIVRRGDRLSIEHQAGAVGNLWRGCLLDGIIWSTMAHDIVGYERLGEGAETFDRIRRLNIDGGYENVDTCNAACDPVRKVIYFGDFVGGHVGRVEPATGQLRRTEVGGLIVHVMWRKDGRLVVIDSSTLMVFDPSEFRVVGRVPAGLAMLGHDICPKDDAVVTTDFSGRIREFTPDGDASYRFAWGLNVAAPRRIAYSPGCDYIAVASGNDHSVFIIDRRERRVIRTFDVGPALREISFIGPREAAVADACSITSLRF